jgi:transcriptional regulator with XRE-family HTH domain
MENPIDAARLRAVLAMRGTKRHELARAANCSEAYLSKQCAGEKPITASVVEAVRGVLGAEAWSYVTRQTDVLHSPLSDGR